MTSRKCWFHSFEPAIAMDSIAEVLVDAAYSCFHAVSVFRPDPTGRSSDRGTRWSVSSEEEQ